MSEPNRPPLWMPHGSVRAILAIGLTAVTATAAFVAPDAFALLLPVDALIIRDYFTARDTP